MNTKLEYQISRTKFQSTNEPTLYTVRHLDGSSGSARESLKQRHHAQRKMALALSHGWPLFYGTDEYPKGR